MNPCVLEQVGRSGPVCCKTDKEHHLLDVSAAHFTWYISYLLSATNIVDDPSCRCCAKTSSRSKLNKLSSNTGVGNSCRVMIEPLGAHSCSTAVVRCCGDSRKGAKALNSRLQTRSRKFSCIRYAQKLLHPIATTVTKSCCPRICRWENIQANHPYTERVLILVESS